MVTIRTTVEPFEVEVAVGLGGNAVGVRVGDGDPSATVAVGGLVVVGFSGVAVGVASTVSGWAVCEGVAVSAGGAAGNCVTGVVANGLALVLVPLLGDDVGDEQAISRTAKIQTMARACPTG